jgi:hypothetical protein
MEATEKTDLLSRPICQIRIGRFHVAFDPSIHRKSFSPAQSEEENAIRDLGTDPGQ